MNQIKRGRRWIFGVCVRYWQRKGGWWWRCLLWSSNRRSIGPYRTRPEAVKDSAQQLHCHEALRGARK
jgi:hypothetical protein